LAGASAAAGPTPVVMDGAAEKASAAAPPAKKFRRVAFVGAQHPQMLKNVRCMDPALIPASQNYRYSAPSKRAA